MNKKVIVMGSYNAGLFLKGSAIPHAGETLLGYEYYEGGGGKGSNQAIAAARLGADVSFGGKIGNDAYGKYALKLYADNHINSDRILTDPHTHTGVSVILLNEAGDNAIMVVPGANYRLSEQDMEALLSDADENCIVGFQLENRLEAVLHGIETASRRKAEVLLDPAPAVHLPDGIYKSITYIKPNEHEASVLTGIPVTGVESAYLAGQWFIRRGVQYAVITLGAGGAVLVAGDRKAYFPAPWVPVVDTTGAGDCFSGAMLYSLSGGGSIEEAIRLGTLASTVSVTRAGVVESLPTMEEINQLKERLKLQAVKDGHE